jgi:hypothetical protein
MKVFITLGLLLFSVVAASQNPLNISPDASHGSKSESYKSLADDGSWCWFSDPRAIYFEGKYKRTYAGWINSSGDVIVGYYDHDTKEIQSKTLVENYEKDDHDNPALLIIPDGRMMVFFTRHGGPNPTLLFTMKYAEDIMEWDKQELFLNDMETYNGFGNTNTYVNPVLLTGENNRIYLFWRGVDNKPNYSISDDLGKTWSKSRIFVLPERIYAMRRPYMKVESNGKNKIVFAFTDGHPRNENENSIYFMYYERGSFYNVEGEKIGEPGMVPVNPREASVVYDATVTKQKSWIWDVALDENENPVLVYVRFPDDKNHIYSYARWDGKKWNTRDLINSGAWFPSDTIRELNYSGGLVLDHENPDILYLSVNRGSGFEIEKWTTTKGVSKWKAEAITRNSGKDNVRPFAVRNATGKNPLQLLWMQNNYYVHYTDFNTSVKMNILVGK